MSEADNTASGGGEKVATQREDKRADMARSLARGGMSGVHVVTLETAKEVLTPKRTEILESVRSEEIGSVRELARELGRDKGQVSRDLKKLAEHGLITYEESGRSKKPVIPHDHVVVEPII